MSRVVAQQWMASQVDATVYLLSFNRECGEDDQARRRSDSE